MNTVTPDVSFVIAAFNAEDTIVRAVESALAQAGVSVEVIVADDCSTDRTADRVLAIADARVRLITLERNGGPGAARNAGLAAATGAWVAVLDADDAVSPGRLQAMIARAQQAGAQIAVDNIELVSGMSSSGTMFPEHLLKQTSEIDLAAFIGSNMLFSGQFNFGYMKPVIERRFLAAHDLRFDTSLRIGEDYIFLASALAKGGRCAVEPMAGYLYSLRAGSISSVLELSHVEAMLAADEAFVARHALDRDADRAQARRRRNLLKAQSFLKMVQHLKDRSAGGFIKTALRDPQALRLLRMPLAARLRRFFAATDARRRPAASSLGRGPQSTEG